MADKDNKPAASGGSALSIVKGALGFSPLKLSMIVFLAVAGLYVFKVMAPTSALHLYVQERVLQILTLIENKAYDYRFLAAGDRKADDRLVIVTIDEKAIAELGRWPWLRSTIGKGLKNIMDDGATVMGFDSVFAEPDPNDKVVRASFDGLERKLADSFYKTDGLLPANLESKINEIASAIPNQTPAGELREIYQELKSREAALMSAKEGLKKDIADAAHLGSDETFAKTIEQYADRTVLGYFMFKDKDEIGEGGVTSNITRFELVSPSQIVNKIEMKEQTAPEPFMSIWPVLGIVPNIEILSKAGRHFGYFNADQDVDGVIRKHEVFLRHQDMVVPSLAMEMTRTYLKHSFPDAEIAFEYNNEFNGVTAVKIGPLDGDQFIEIPTDESGKLLINYYGGKGTYPHISFADAVSGSFAPGTFKDKIVLFGATSVGVYDLRTTPFERALPGVEIHAAVINNILNQDFKRAPDAMTRVQEIFIMFVACLFLGFVLPRLSAVTGAFVAFLTMIAVIWLNFYFFQQGIWLNLVFPLLAVVATYSTITVYRYATEEKEKRQIKSAFGYYLHPEMVKKLADDPGALKLGGEKKILTAFFSDIEGFSTFSEKMQPEELVTFLNVYLTEMTNIAYQYDATVDKYIGDAIVSFYGAPVPFEDHAIRACHSAIDMQTKLAELREGWLKQGLPQVRMRIGLNTGPMVIGNMGSQSRFNYTMMGDSVNLAARLESQCKAYHIYIMCGEDTYGMAKDGIDARFLDNLVVKGKTKPVKVYEVLGKKNTVTGPMAEVVPLWEEAMKRHLSKDFQGAIALYEKILAIRPDDGPTEVFMKRTKEYLVAPPPENWDGAYVAKTK